MNQEETTRLYNEKKPEIVTQKQLRNHEDRTLKTILNTADTALAIMVLTPCVVGFWRGIWGLLELHENIFSPLTCLLIGLFTYIISTFIQELLNETIKEKSTNWTSKLSKMFLRRLYTYMFGITSVMYWRGGFFYVDWILRIKKDSKGLPLKESSQIVIGAFLLAVLGIMGLRSLRNTVAPPFVFCLDRKDMTFTIPTRFKMKMQEKTSLYILDCLFSVLIVGTFVVFVWRGAWALVDIFLFPENEIYSAWGSLIVGYSSVGIAFMMQPFMRWLCDRITGVSRLLAADCFLIISLIGTVNVWRGIWNLLNLYFLPDHFELSCWITHWFSLLVLILLGCSNSLLVRGVYIDAEEPGGKCIVFPCHYLRLIFKKEDTVPQKTELKPIENNHVSEEINHRKECV